MSVISIFSIGITGNGVKYSQVRVASARPPCLRCALRGRGGETVGE
jgi:hypothetical protein